jgi:hypothetical protein
MSAACLSANKYQCLLEAEARLAELGVCLNVPVDQILICILLAIPKQLERDQNVC